MASRLKISMNLGTPRSILSESNEHGGSQRRRSPRLSSPPQDNLQTDKKMAQASAAVKRRITVRKIAPRKTTAPSEHNKENTPKRRESDGGQQKKLKESTPCPAPQRGSSSVEKKKKAAALSPILPSTPPPSRPLQPANVQEDAVWSQKVRRSYSRLSDKSLLSSPDSRDTLFGFDKLQTPEVGQRVRRCRSGPEASASSLTSFASLLEVDDCGAALPEPDHDIPGVSVVKEKKRRRRVQQINTTEMEAMAAEMNAVFEEAQEFELTVE